MQFHIARIIFLVPFIVNKKIIEDEMKNIFHHIRWDPQQKVEFHCQVLSSFLKEAFFGGGWNELFGPKRFEPSVIVVWPRELVRLIENCLENIFIIYHMVIRRLEKFLRACEVQIQIFWQKIFKPAVIVVWPRELVRWKVLCL